AEADLLRRAMTGKSRTQDEFVRLKERFHDACLEKGYPKAEVKEIWRQIESFAGYSFSKAHSASFAVESFQSLYLKAYYPLEFMVAVINNFGGFYSTEFYLHEARQWGGNVLAPCVNESVYLTSIQEQNIYLGFVHVKDLEEKLAKKIVEERKLRGVYKSFSDFRHRIQASEEQLTILVRVGAFRFTEQTKTTLLWETKLQRSLMNGHVGRQVETLFALEEQDYEVPQLPQTWVEDAYDEIELLGFPLCSPFELVPNLPENGIVTSSFPQNLNRVVCIAGYFICAKTTKTVHGDYMQFANFVDTEGETFDVTIFPPEAKQYPLTGSGVYMVTGMVVEEFGVYSIELMTLKKYLYLEDTRL
ncbi:MAG: DNA polymerase III subunit alpha, partial [Bacteroidota bacterium]